MLFLIIYFIKSTSFFPPVNVSLLRMFSNLSTATDVFRLIRKSKYVGARSLKSSSDTLFGCVYRFAPFVVRSGTFPIFHAISDLTNGGLYPRCRFRPLRDFEDRTILFALLTSIGCHTYLPAPKLWGSFIVFLRVGRVSNWFAKLGFIFTISVAPFLSEAFKKCKRKKRR